ncbi:MAG: AAA family ATPase [Erysipelotrichaceae bacterium]|nr:AAA family ATPase [Erysipelotrichaceae bacterium]
MQKKLIIVSAPPASGKTYVSMKLAETLKHVVYLDKDSLVPLSNVAYQVAGLPAAREGEFFQHYLRDVEYNVILDMAFQALKYDDLVLINAPFTKEIHTPSFIVSLREKLEHDYNARLVIVWVTCDMETVHQRMIERNSPRDVFKLKNFDAWVKTQDFEIPWNLKIENDPYSLVVFNNSNDQEFRASMKATVRLLEEKKR